MKIAIIPTTGGSDPYRSMEMAVELGVEGVHVRAVGGPLDLENKTSAERAEVLKRIHGYGLEVSAMIGWGGNVDLGEAEGWEENIEWGKRLNEVTVDMAAGLWIAHVGIMPEEASDPRWARVTDALGQLAAHGESVGAILALETGPEPPSVLRRMIEQIDSPAIRVNFDPANLLIWPPIIAERRDVPFDYERVLRDFDPVEGLRTLIPYVVHSHAKDSILYADGTSKEVVLGTGMAKWPELHAVFQANDYPGFYAIEREVGEDPMGDVRKGVEFLRGL